MAENKLDSEILTPEPICGIIGVEARAMERALVTELQGKVRDIQRLSGHAQSMLSGRPLANKFGGTKVVNIADVMSQLLWIHEAASEAIRAIEVAADAAGKREKAGRGV
jgi:hypothetical protein